MTRRMLASYLGLVVLLLIGLELPLAVLAQRFERQLAAASAEREASGIAAVVSEYAERSQTGDLRSVVAGYQSRTGGEVTVISADGSVIAASNNDAENDASDEWKSLASRALAGQQVSQYTYDEGVPVAVAAVPLTIDGRTLGALVLAAPANDAESRIHEIWLVLAIFAAGAIGVSAMLGVLLARSMAGPLARLEAAVSRFGHGDLAARARVDAGPSEIRSVAEQFNAMAGQLDELVAAQSRFVADASHQLRSPLTALRLRLENLEASSEPDAAADIAAAGAEVLRLSRIVDGLLTLSRAGQDQPIAERVDVASVMQQRCEAWSALAEEKGVELVAATPPGGPVVARVVAGDLDQILDNLIANALEVSPPGGRLRVELSKPEGGRTELHVIDEGPGLSEEERQRAFDRFWQGASLPSGHSGLGLSIVRQLAQRNGAAVELLPVDPTGLDAAVTLLGVSSTGSGGKLPSGPGVTAHQQAAPRR